MYSTYVCYTRCTYVLSVENGGQVPIVGMNTCTLMPYSEVGYVILVNSDNKNLRCY